ncbi:MAG: putative addiction module antidote protein [Rickettsiales bacterium]|jgi:probable addiction module antidote protein|nr:putative addiction module antidote protein [Rickettsiales bacterium]
MAKTKLRKFDLANYLTDEEVITEYLNLELDEGDPRYIKSALENIARARKRNMTQLAKKAGVPRITLYRALSKEGNPEFDTMHKIVKALDMKLVVVPKNARIALRKAA